MPLKARSTAARSHRIERERAKIGVTFVRAGDAKARKLRVQGKVTVQGPRGARRELSLDAGGAAEYAFADAHGEPIRLEVELATPLFVLLTRAERTVDFP